MKGIRDELLTRLREVLLKCHEFDSHNNLKAVFVGDSLNHLQDKLPDQPNSKENRVDQVIDFLWKENTSDKKNCLVLFVLILSKKTPPENSRHQELTGLADEIERHITSITPTKKQDSRYQEEENRYRDDIGSLDIDEFYASCQNILLRCEQFENSKKLRSFCRKKEHGKLNFVAFKIKNEYSQQELYELILKIKNQEGSRIFPIFLEALIQDYEGDDRQQELQEILAKFQKANEPPQAEQQRNYSWIKNELFKSLIKIDFQDQNNSVKSAIESRNKKAIESQKKDLKTAAFLVHGYDNRYGQAFFIERLFREIQEFKKGTKIQIKLDTITENSHLWEQIAPYFLGSFEPAGMLQNQMQQQIIDKISECLQSQNLIFIFKVYDSCLPETLSDLIKEFWQPIVYKVNHDEFYLAMFLVDYGGKCANRLGVNLTASFDDDQQYPKFPLFLNKISHFTYEHLNEWLGNVVKDESVHRKLLADRTHKNFVEQLFKESQWGIPKLVYQNICSYFDVSLEEIDQCQIR